MDNSQNNVVVSLVPTAVFWGSAYFLFTQGYKRTALTMGAIGLLAPIVLLGGGLLYLRRKGYFNPPPVSPSTVSFDQASQF